MDVDRLVRIVQDLHHLLLKAPHFDLLEPCEPADAIVDVYNVISAPKLRQFFGRDALEPRPTGRTAPLEAAEDLMFREHGQLCGRVQESRMQRLVHHRRGDRSTRSGLSWLRDSTLRWGEWLALNVHV
jgi:hypothetical protein